MSGVRRTKPQQSNSICQILPNFPRGVDIYIATPLHWNGMKDESLKFVSKLLTIYNRNWQVLSTQVLAESTERVWFSGFGPVLSCQALTLDSSCFLTNSLSRPTARTISHFSSPPVHVVLSLAVLYFRCYLATHQVGLCVAGNFGGTLKKQFD